ncbi:MAG: hypothetical protein ACOH10_07855 [Rhodoglobus sp.]
MTAVEGCTHRVQHQHGDPRSYGECCRCVECSRARSRALKHVRFYGPRPIVSTATVRVHLLDLLAAGMAAEAIGKAARTEGETVRRIVRGERPQIEAAIVGRLLAVTLRPTSVGVARRIQALQRIGWGGPAIAAALGVTATVVSERANHPGAFVNAKAAAKVAAVYDHMATGCPDPNPITIGRARAKGWAPPLAWDDETIDDIRAEPAGIVPTRLSLDELVEDLLDMADSGRSWAEAAERCGYRVPMSLERRLYRADRGDVVAAFKRQSVAA